MLKSAFTAVYLAALFVGPVAFGQKFSHDQGDRLIEISYRNSTSIGFTLDQSGNVRSIMRTSPLKIKNPNNGNSYSLIECGAWSSCKVQARGLGAELVTIRSKSEEEWLNTTFPPSSEQIPSSFWIGANDLVTEGTWVWSSDEPVTYLNWHRGEPNNWQGREHVAHMWLVEGVYAWNDLPDDTSYGLRRAVVEFNNAKWDARLQYSHISNPTPPWRYARRLASGDLQAFDEHRSTCPALPTAPSNAFACWKVAGDPGLGLPMVAINTTQEPFRDLTVEVPTNALVLHPGEDGDSAVVQFTVPQTGRYGVIASFESIDVTPFGVDVLLTVDGAPLIGQSLSQFRQAVGISQSFSLTKDQVLSFEVGPGANGYGNDSVALRVRVTPLP